jgi:hypothetical protein
MIGGEESENVPLMNWFDAIQGLTVVVSLRLGRL